MTVTNIEDARRRRQERETRIRSAADWILHNLPFGISWRDSPIFRDRYPDIDGAALNAVTQEIQRRIVFEYSAPVTRAQLNLAVLGLSGRPEVWMRAADWLATHLPGRGIDDPEFHRHFGDLTMAELALATTERLKRELCAAGHLV